LQAKLTATTSSAEAQEAGDVKKRSQRLQEIEAAYNKLRVAGQRARVDFFLLDPRVGLKQCEAIAQSLLSPDTKVEGLIQPKSVRVSHAAIQAEPKRYLSEPPPVSGLHPQPIESERLDALRSLPAPLAITFDC
jgi:hypothetical protein